MAWNQPINEGANARKPSAHKSPSIAKGVIAGVVVVALAVAVYFLLFSKGPEKPKVEKVEKKPAQLAEVKPAAAPKAVEKVPKEDPAKKTRREMLAKMTKEERFLFIYDEMKRRPLDLEPTTNRPFRTGTEQVMSWIFTTRFGDMPPPLPRIPIRDEAHMAEILIANNPVLESDSEKVKEAKAMVELAKKELREFLKKGGDVQDFLSYYRGELVQAHNEWTESSKSVMRMVRDDPDLVGEYVKEVNARLTAKGIKPVKLPKNLKEKLGIVEGE